MLRSVAKLIGILTLVAPLGLAAQSTGTPVFMAPYRPFAASETAVTFSDPGPGFALEGSYRARYRNNLDLSFRGGLSDGGSRNSAGILLGVDTRTRVLDHTESFPLDGSLTLGLGISSAGGFTTGYLPVGLSLGRRVVVEGSSLSLVPYLHTVLTPRFGDGHGTDLTLGFGADLRISPRLDLRISAGLGDRDGIALTAAFLR